METILSNIKERVLQIAENKGIAKEKFFEEIGVTYGNFKGIAKSKALSSDTLATIVSIYGDVSPEWLLTGKGEMLRHKEIIPVGKHAHSRLKEAQYEDAFSDWQGLPIFNAPISASFIEQYKDIAVYEPEYYLRDPRFRDCDFGAKITGDSMHSEIRHGDSIVCKELFDKSFIVFGEIYYIVAKNGLETCKYVNAGKDEKHILLVPRNEKISATPIKKDMIKNIYKVRGILRGY